MEDLPRALDEDLLKELECPVCMQYMVPPIKLCTNGHNICSKCRQRVQFCPACRAEFSEIRNVALENIVRSQKYPCANRQNGCLDLFSIEHVAKHHAVCEYRKIKCPIYLLKKCSWNGLKSNLKGHAQAAHPSRVLERPSFLSYSFADAMLFLSCFGEFFTYRKQIKNGIFYCAVQLIGTSSEASKYKSEFTLHAANGIEQISKTFLVQGYSEDFEAIFNSGKCLKLHEETVEQFVEGDKIKLTVTLSTV